MNYRMLVLIVTVLFGGIAAAAEPTMAELGQLDQEPLRQMFYEKYTPYLNAYIGLYVAQEKCKYSFIDEPYFNELADSVIKQAVHDISIGLQSAKYVTVRDNTNLRDYVANMLAFAMIDAQSHVITARQAVNYSDAKQCEINVDTNRAVYEQLPKMASTIANARYSDNVVVD